MHHYSRAYADPSGEELVIDVSSNSNGGHGINVDGHTRLDDLFGVDNQGTQTTYAFIRLIGNGAKTNAYLYDSDNQEKALSPDIGKPGSYADQGESDPLLPDPSDIEYSARKLNPGERLKVGLDIEDVDSDIFQQTETIQVVATTSASQVTNFPSNTHD